MPNRESLYNLGKPNEKVELVGTLVYSSLTKKVKPFKPSPYDQEPAYRITIANPKVTKGADTELGKNILRTDITHGAYKSVSGKNAGDLMWSFVNNPNGKRDIEIFTRKTKGQSLPAPKMLKGELAPGQKVGVLFSLYAGERPGGQSYVSGGVDGVIIDSPKNIKYFGDGAGAGYSDFFSDEEDSDLDLKDFAANNDTKPETKSEPKAEAEAPTAEAPAEEEKPKTKKKSSAELASDDGDLF